MEGELEKREVELGGAKLKAKEECPQQEEAHRLACEKRERQMGEKQERERRCVGKSWMRLEIEVVR